MLQNPNANKEFQPREYKIGDQTYTAYTPGEANKLEQQQSEHIKQTNAMAGSPDRPEYDTMIDPATGMISDQYQLAQATQSALGDDAGYNKFEQEALRDGPSAYANLMIEQQGLERKDQLDDINSQYNMGMQTALDGMASQGGLYGGAKERLGANSIRDMLATRQGARSDYQKQRLGILGQDEQNRVGQLQSLSGMEMDRNRLGLQGKEFDIRNSMTERDNVRRDSQDAWKTEMETWASNKQADAQSGAAGGCFPTGTLIEMADGSKKKIEDIKLGDDTFGGTVTKLIQGLAFGAKWYNYEGVIVTGDHAVYEEEEWVRVKDSDLGESLDIRVEYLYNISNAGHMLLIKDTLFSDFDEVEDATLSYEDSLMEKNVKSCLNRIS
jgi:hypothetical protein